MSKRIINLNEPEGNTFMLLGVLSRGLKDLGLTPEEIKKIRTEAISGDYNKLLTLFEKHLGDFYTFEGDPRTRDDDMVYGGDDEDEEELAHI